MRTTTHLMGFLKTYENEFTCLLMILITSTSIFLFFQPQKPFTTTIEGDIYIDITVNDFSFYKNLLILNLSVNLPPNVEIYLYNRTYKNSAELSLVASELTYFKPARLYQCVLKSIILNNTDLKIGIKISDELTKGGVTLYFNVDQKNSLIIIYALENLEEFRKWEFLIMPVFFALTLSMLTVQLQVLSAKISNKDINYNIYTILIVALFSLMSNLDYSFLRAFSFFNNCHL